MKKLVAPIMAAVMVTSMAVPVMADYKVSFNGSSAVVSQVENRTKLIFVDVPSNNWAYKPIMNMVNKGIIAGTTTPVNGVGTFSPDTPMTRAQFITVVTRYLYPNDLKTVKVAPGSAWYAGNYDVAVDKGLIYEHEFSSDGAIMNQSMTRQEMAMVLVRAMDALGEDTTDKISKNRIPDFNKVGTHYADYVRVAYKEGLICGTDSAGTFNPHGTLTRAQAATVLNRLITPSDRTPVSEVAVQPSTPTQTPAPVTGTSWYEGAKHGVPKAGDTVIKADGTKVVLKETKFGAYSLLGFGQNVDCVTGTVINGVTAKPGMGAWKGYDPVNNDASMFVKDEITGCVFTTNQWAAVAACTRPTQDGTYEGQKANTYFEWDATIETWMWVGPNFNQ